MSDNPLLKVNPPIGKEKYQPTNWVSYQLPLYTSCKLAVIANAKGQKKLEKAYGVSLEKDPAFHPENDSLGNTIVIRDKGGAECHIIAVDLEGIMSAGAMMHAQLAAVVAHEASHVCDSVFEHIGEGSPGTESRAYLLQWVTEAVLEFYYLRFASLRQYHEH